MNNAELQLHLESARVTELITLNNGIELSIQASAAHYSSPKQDHGPWNSVEVGISHKDYFKALWLLEDADIRKQFDLVSEDYWIAGWLNVDKLLNFIKLCNEA